MTLTRRIHPEAALELLEAAQWYEVARADLGDDFLSEVGVTERHVLDWPEAARVFPGWDELPVVRSAGVRVFPYRVLYYLTDTGGRDRRLRPQPPKAEVLGAPTRRLNISARGILTDTKR